MPLLRVDRGGVHADHDFVVFGHGLIEFLKFKDIRRSVLFEYDGFHIYSRSGARENQENKNIPENRSRTLISSFTYHPRWAMRSSLGMSVTWRPTMASPRLRLSPSRFMGLLY